MRRAHKKSHSCSGIIAVIVAFMIFTGCIMFNSFRAFAQEQPDAGSQNKYYKSITIEDGDTLWGIAEEHLTDDYESVEAYVKDLKAMNNLSGDKIISGHKLVIAY